MGRLRILIADDHAEVRRSVEGLLATEFDVVGTAADGLQLLSAAEELDPDVIVVDVSMPAIDGIEAARRLRERGCGSALVFLTVHRDASTRAAAMRAGASAYVLKDRAGEDLIPAIRAARGDGPRG